METAEKIIEELRQLPSDLQREVLDFAYFLRQSRLDGEQEENLMEAQQASLGWHWENEDDDIWNDA